MSIEPYTKNKSMRNALEQVAEAYCEEKRSAQLDESTRKPDYIFTTDGCSRWPDGSWGVCCIAHDISYWCGGSEQDRKDADQELMRCVNDYSPMMGAIVYAGVRIGGLPWLPAPWRWSYGWDQWPGSYEETHPSPSQRDLFEELKVYKLIEQHLFKNHP